MKKVLFLGVTKFDFQNFPPFHLKEKFLGLSGKLEIFVLAKGKPFHKKIWETDFYLLSPFLFWPKAFFLAFYLCLAKKIDTVVAQSPLIEGLVGSKLKFILRKELIVEVHGDWIEGPFLSKKRKLEKIERKITPFLAKISFKSADKIRTVADYLTEKAKEIAPGKKYYKFPTFTDLEMFLNEKETSFENYILFVGQLAKVKGVKYLIEAFFRIERDFPNFKLIIIGEGPEKENLKSQISNLKIENRVEFRGKISLQETKEIMKRCYCLVLPSLSEGLPRVILEAMALAKPVVASKVGGIPELIKDSQNGFLFGASNLDALTEKLIILLDNKDLAVEMGKRGRDFVVQNFSNKKYIENYIQMINNPRS